MKLDLQDSRRALLGLLALALLPALVLVDTAAALARGWRTVSRLDHALIAASLIALLVACLAFVTPKGRALFARRFRELVLLVGTLTICWLFVEAILAIWVHPQSPEQQLLHRRWPNLQRVFQPRPAVMPGIEGDSHYSTNALGLRGPELPPHSETYRIVCVGGSTTECLFLDDSETWPHLLMQRLNDDPELRRVWFGNAGIAGYSATQHLRFVEQWEYTSEMDAMLFLVGINDLGGYLLRAAGQAPEDPWSELSLRARRAAPLWRRSGVLALLRVVWHRWTRSYEVEDPQGANYDVRRSLRRRAPMSDTLPPGLDASLRDYQTRIRAIIQACRRRGVHPVFATHPVLWDERNSQAARELLWMGAMRGGSYLSPGKLRETMDRFNAALTQVCDEMHVGCIDLSALHGREELFYDDCHFNEAGAQQVADSVFQWFRDHAADYDLRTSPTPPLNKGG
jgi:lysophospholipase L1-like esterase